MGKNKKKKTLPNNEKMLKNETRMSFVYIKKKKNAFRIVVNWNRMNFTSSHDFCYDGPSIFISNIIFFFFCKSFSWFPSIIPEKQGKKQILEFRKLWFFFFFFINHKQITECNMVENCKTIDYKKKNVCIYLNYFFHPFCDLLFRVVKLIVSLYVWHLFIIIFFF